MPEALHIQLSAQKAAEYRQWARDNDPPNPEWWENYHPECRNIWLKKGLMPRKIAAEWCEKASDFISNTDDAPINIINMLNIIKDSLERREDDLL